MKSFKLLALSLVLIILASVVALAQDRPRLAIVQGSSGTAARPASNSGSHTDMVFVEVALSQWALAAAMMMRSRHTR
ncbi:MAG: hypothetical protein LBV04_01820 [Deferribacteraceae bacterium]|jgi:hypothetical protein|nr:hypothetical protein [Deferribacteraceae bacterium]